MTDQSKVFQTAIYIRLSKEDEEGMESVSVAHQRQLLYHYLEARPELKLCAQWIDDGFSGLDFNRPGIKGLFEDIRQGKINCIVVKDLSRFGRNYIETGRYLEEIFPKLGVRFIAVTDGYDSLLCKEDWYSVLLPFRNLLNDAYSGDISVKVRSQLMAGWREGLFMGAFPPYGYLKSDENRHMLEEDREASRVVRAVYCLKIQGYSQEQIACKLNDKNIPAPLEHKKNLGMAYYTSFRKAEKALWTAQSVGRLLKDRVYLGEMIQGKEVRPNYKVKKKIKRPEDQRIVVKECHNPILEEWEFELVQNLLKRDTRVSPYAGKLYFFSGLLYCKCCHCAMVRKSVTVKGKKYDYYLCGGYKRDRELCQNNHSFSEERLHHWFDFFWGREITRGLLVMLVDHINILDRMRLEICYSFCEERSVRCPE